jgi:hypothetical protein
VLANAVFPHVEMHTIRMDATRMDATRMDATTWVDANRTWGGRTTASHGALVGRAHLRAVPHHPLLQQRRAASSQAEALLCSIMSAIATCSSALGL